MTTAMTKRSLPAILGWGMVVLSGYAAEEPEADPKDLPRIPFTLPENALDTFEVKKGFRLELAAHEPLLEDPIAVDFDEDGRLFAVEMRGYSERREEARGRIRMLVDDDDDGIFDRATVYAEGLKWPTAVVCFDGGVFVVANPDLWYFKDTDGDGAADVKEIVFTGFGLGKGDRLNVQALANSLRWGPDNRIWGATAGNGGELRRPDQPESQGTDLNGRDFSFDPRTRELRAESGTAQNGMSFDSRGRRFVCSNSRHIIAVMWEQNQVVPGAYFSMPQPLAEIAVDGGAAPVFRISPDEPWRIVRTRWRVASLVKGPVEGGGRVSGYFTGASGITIYTGDAFGPEFVDNAFTGDVGSNLMHRKIVRHRENVTALEALRPKDEQEMEFVRSRDNWFRPTTFANGPDGCLYIVDMYREVIEHPWSLPEGIKKHLDLNSGTERGRLYRVVPARHYTRRPTRKLGAASNDELAALLDHPNGWHRVTAQRLLWERGDSRAGAGWGKPPPAGSAEARYRRALALAAERGDAKALELAALVEKSRGDTWVEAAVLNAIATGTEAKSLFEKLIADTDANAAFLPELAELTGKTKDDGAVKAVLTAAVENAGSPAGLSLLQSLGTGLASARSSLAKADVDGLLRPVFTSALAAAIDTNRPEGDRVRWIRLAAYAPGSEAPEILASVLRNADSAALQLAAINALGERNAKELGDLLVEGWEKFNPQVRATALALFLARTDRITTLLQAIEAGTIARTQLSPNEVETLRGHRDAKVKKLAANVLPEEQKESRASVVARYRPALEMKADVAKGKAIYEAICIACHRSGGQGFPVGPDMVTFKLAGKDSILVNLFDPNQEVAPQYQAYTFTLTTGETVLGIIANETVTEVTIRQAFGVEKTVPRKEVASMKALGLSLMPEGMESGLTPQNVADLLEYIAAAD